MCGGGDHAYFPTNGHKGRNFQGKHTTASKIFSKPITCEIENRMSIFHPAQTTVSNLYTLPCSIGPGEDIYNMCSQKSVRSHKSLLFIIARFLVYSKMRQMSWLDAPFAIHENYLCTC